MNEQGSIVPIIAMLYVICCRCCFSAPSQAPLNVSGVPISADSILVQWQVRISKKLSTLLLPRMQKIKIQEKSQILILKNK